MAMTCLKAETESEDSSDHDFSQLEYTTKPQELGEPPYKMPRLQGHDTPKVKASTVSPVQCGTSCLLECTVTSEIPITEISWLKNEKQLALTSKYKGGTIASPSLEVLNVDDDDTGQYQCRVVNAAGKEWSNMVQLDVGDIPLITLPSTNYNATTGDFVTIRCKIKSENLPYSITWFKMINDKQVPVLNYSQFSGGTINMPSLTIQNVVENDMGCYVCCAENVFGKITSDKILLTVEKDLKYPGSVVCDGMVIDCIVDHNLEGLKSSPALPERPKSVPSFADHLKNAQLNPVLNKKDCKEIQSHEDTNQINNYNMLRVYQRRLSKENHHCLESWKQILFWSIEKNHDLLCRYVLANGQILNDNIEVWMSTLEYSISMQNSTCSKAIAWHITKLFAKSLSSLEEVFDIWPGFVCRCSAGMELKREHFCSRNVVIVVELNDQKPNGFPDYFYNYQIQYKIMNGYSEEGKSVVLETNRMYSDSEPETLPEGIKSNVAATYFQNYRKLFLISPSLLKSKFFKTNQQFDQMPCIQLYCRVKGIIPIGEAHFPTSISSVPTDVLEGHAQLLMKNIRIGSEIGPVCGRSGTLGGFVKYLGNNAFITCAHVLLSKESLFKSTERQKIHQQPAHIKYINQGEIEPPTLCGKLINYMFPPDCSKDGTSVDAAIVTLDDSEVKINPDDLLLDNGIHRTFGDFGMQSVYLNDNFVDYKQFGTTMSLTSRSAGIVSGIQEKTVSTCCEDENVIKFEEFSQVIDRLLIENPKPKDVTVDVHIKEQIRKIDDSTNEIPSTVTLYNQISFRNISFERGDSGTCIYVADSSNTATGCIGMAIASHPNGGCIITPLKAILSAFKMI